MWHKPCRTFHPWCPCIKTRCLLTYWGRVIHMLNGNPSLVQIMACRLVGTKPLPVPVLEIVNCTIRKKHRPNLNRNWYGENIFEHVVCEMLVILSRFQSVIRLEYWSWNRTYQLPVYKHVPLSRYTLGYHGALRSMLISLYRWWYLCWSYFMKINFFGNFYGQNVDF